MIEHYYAPSTPVLSEVARPGLRDNPLSPEFWSVPVDTGCRPFEPQAEISGLKHRMSVLEKRMDGLLALLAHPKDPEGSSGAPAAPTPRSDIDLDILILAQRQHHQQHSCHQQSPWARQ